MSDDAIGTVIKYAMERLDAARADLRRQHEDHAKHQEMPWAGSGDEYEEGTRKAGEAARLARAEAIGAFRALEAVASWCNAMANDMHAQAPVEGGAAVAWVADAIREHIERASSSDP